MKIFTVVANENWICDRLVGEWQEHAGYAKSYTDAEVIWVFSPSNWRLVPPEILKTKKVVVTIHHITPQKFTKDSLREFLIRDKIVDFYHVTCKQTEDFLKKITKKPIFKQPFWVNSKNWFSSPKQELRQKYSISQDAFLVGSFQRDTEGYDLKSPKLEKGPDLFCDIVEKMNNQVGDLQVLLAGWRRQYVIGRLEKAGIKYQYFERPDLSVVNDLYNCLDLYVVSARTEGGPQSIVECAANKTPIISTDVGIASVILAPESIYDPAIEIGKPNVELAYENVQKYLVPSGFKPFIDFFKTSFKLQNV